MTLATQPLDNQQTQLEQNFIQLAQEHSQELAQQYLQLYGNRLSIRLAAELSENFRHSNLTRGYYREAVAPGARLILNQAWQFILERRSENKPLLVIAGGGPGSGKLTAIAQPLLALTKETIGIYDVSNHTAASIQQLINHSHTLNIPTILAYIARPLPYAARAAIERDITEGVTPDPEAFATTHYETYNAFLSLTNYYRKANKIFTAIVITNLGPPDLTQSTKPFYLGQFKFTIAEASDVFTTILNETLNDLPTVFPDPRPISLKLPRKPRSAKTLTGQSTLIGYLLSQSLRTTLISKEQATQGRSRSLKDSSTGPQPPIQTLVHIEPANTQPITTTDKRLENERPLRTVVRETPTRCHEMETVLVR
jgi:hypothetical protein